MTWGVFYRPPQCSDWEDSQGGVRDGQSLSFIKEYSPRNPATIPSPQPYHQPCHSLISPRHPHPPPPPIRNPPSPQFRNPLSDLIRNDPAFSSDPRSHPHFPLTNARSYKDPPSKSLQNYTRHVSLSHEAPHSLENVPITEVLPRISPRPLTEERRTSPLSASVSLECASITTHSTFTPSTASPATSHSHSLPQTSGGRTAFSVAPTSQSTANSSPSSQPQFKNELNLPVSQVLDHPSVLFHTSAPEVTLKAQKPSVLPRTKSIVAKGGMKKLFRRLTNRHGLDRIDEMDETDPFGGSYHHDGPYEAIGNSLAKLGPPHMYNDFVRGDLRNPKRETTTHPSHRVKHKSSTRVPPPTEGENGLFLHLEPGQILQRNAVYAVPIHNGSTWMTPTPNLSRRKAGASVAQPAHSRRQSLPNSLMRHREVTPLAGPQNSNESYSSPPGPRVHYFGDDIPRIPNRSPRSHINRDIPASTVLPPTPRESASHGASPSPFPQLTQPPPPDLISQQGRLMDRPMSDLPPQGLRHRGVGSLDSSRPPDRTKTTQSSGAQVRSLEPPRMRHLPKCLVMPAPLQPQPPTLPPTQAQFVALQHFTSYDIHPDHPGAMYDGGRNPTGKKTTTFPAEKPIAGHATTSHGDSVPTGRNFPSKVVNAAERTKGARRGRLSKRKP
ncbi:hypothetical protein PAXRUDRAFT_821553 [Paxillus rubicundulus Ve08.2h10]|uniref:Uncharacterized protein n=1 Tax=Paxillus rubicundulus Ve08.2h10 TaxID=930991 RepID=A0A0D0EAQ7_9AGAM|nr:hypothetical protein PAXRUDRAFT_821553 [Paxillus rubicundulus Ve08.2h10]